MGTSKRCADSPRTRAAVDVESALVGMVPGSDAAENIDEEITIVDEDTVDGTALL